MSFFPRLYMIGSLLFVCCILAPGSPALAGHKRITCTEELGESSPHLEPPVGSLVGHFVNLVQSGKMLNQNDRSLGHLFVPDGGLCTSTCGSAILMAIGQMEDRDFSNLKTFFVENIVDRARQNWPLLDARMGMLIDRLEVLLPTMAKVYSINLSAHSDYLAGSTGDVTHDITMEKLTQQNFDTLTVAGIQIGSDAAHAIVFLHYDPISNVMFYWNPNYENEIRSAALRSAGNGKIEINIISDGAVWNLIKSTTSLNVLH